MVMAPMAERSSKVQQELASIRDTIESIWVAIVLAFVLRGFVIEAFVIPTGSMAPRLYGEHLDLRCKACGYEYGFGWSSEQDRAAGGWLSNRGASDWRGGGGPGGAECPNCGHDRPQDGSPSGGDRVLVMKYLYRFREPEPWDVVVFKNPQDNRQNYIKRLIGLPGETIEIVHGDIFVSRDGGRTFRIRRKEKPKVQRAMWHVVFDNDYQPSAQAFAEANRGREASGRIAPPDWKPVGPGSEAWELTGLYGRRFAFRGSPADAEAEIAFQAREDTFLPRYGYNPRLQAGRDYEPDVDVISDLKLEAVYFPDAADSRLALTLSSFEHVFRGEIGADGRARLLYRPDEAGAEWAPLAPPAAGEALRCGSGHRVALTHVDFRVTLWLNGRPVLVSRDRTPDTPVGDRRSYPMDYRLLKRRLEKARARVGGVKVPQPKVKIAAAGGPCRLGHVRIMRDVYYTAPKLPHDPASGPDGDFARSLGVQQGQPGWGVEGHPITLARYDDRPDLDEFFVLGDNSPSSLDGRLWTSAAVTLRLYDEDGERVYKLGTVPRYSLIGKAIFVYWPAGFCLPGLPRLPILPNVGRMRLIR